VINDMSSIRYSGADAVLLKLLFKVNGTKVYHFLVNFDRNNSYCLATLKSATTTF
jgi:hypothetical protein